MRLILRLLWLSHIPVSCGANEHCYSFYFNHDRLSSLCYLCLLILHYTDGCAVSMVTFLSSNLYEFTRHFTLLVNLTTAWRTELTLAHRPACWHWSILLYILLCYLYFKEKDTRCSSLSEDPDIERRKYHLVVWNSKPVSMSCGFSLNSAWPSSPFCQFWKLNSKLTLHQTVACISLCFLDDRKLNLDQLTKPSFLPLFLWVAVYMRSINNDILYGSPWEKLLSDQIDSTHWC